MNGDANGVKILWLDPVIVQKPKRQSTLADAAFGWANFNKSEAKRWNEGRMEYKDLRNKGISASLAGKNAYNGLGSTYERYYQADLDYRAMQIGAVSIIFSPFLMETGIVAVYNQGILWKMGLDATGQLIMNGGKFSQIDILDVGLAGFSAPGASAIYGGAADFRLDGTFKIVGYNKPWQTAALDGTFKYAFGGRGVNGVPGNLLTKINFSTPLSTLETNTFIRLMNVPINIGGKALRKGTKDFLGW